MIKVIKNIVCVVLICSLAGAIKADISIPFEMINGLIVVQAEIDGKEGNYIIDSGANGVLLNHKSSHSEVSYQTLNTTLEGKESIIKSFKIGEFETSEIIGFSTDLSNLELYLEKSLAGILGCSIFNPNSLIFDFHNKKMIVSDEGLSQSEIAGLDGFSFQVVEDIPLTKMFVNGKESVFILDTGASAHFFDSNLINISDNGLQHTGVERDVFTAAGKEKISKEYTLPNCTLGNQETAMQAFEKDFSSISKTLGIEITGLLSLRKITKSKVYFDLNSNMLYYH